MKTALTIEIDNYARHEIEDSWFDWSSNWWADFKNCYIAADVESDRIIGYQAIDRNGLCVAIDIHPEFQGKGIENQLIKASACK